MKDMKVLLISEPFGHGHEMAAEALAAGLTQLNGNIKTKSLHAMTHFKPALANLVLNSYRGLLQLIPKAWGRFYEHSKDSGGSMEGLLLRMYEQQMRALLKEYAPDAIVCTHPFPAAVVGHLKQHGHPIPLVGVVTDYDVHSSWVNNQVDLYLVQNDNLASYLRDKGIPAKKILTSGIPVHPKFAVRDHKEQARLEAGLDPDLPMVLIAGGGWGLGPIKEIVKGLMGLHEEVQAVVVCGSNEDLRRKLTPLQKHNRLLKVFGFVDNFSLLMNSSELLVSKPGGLTSSEALVQGTPMMIFEAFGGQESHNADYLTRIGAAAGPVKISRSAIDILQLVKDRDRLKAMNQAALKFAKPDSALEGAQAVMGLCGR